MSSENESETAPEIGLDIFRDAEIWKTVCFGLSMLALGIAFGANWTGKVAYAAWQQEMTGNGFVEALYAPEWVDAVQTLTTVSLVVFVMLLIGMLAVDYRYGDMDE